MLPGSTVVVVAESPQPGEIGTGGNISFFYNRNLSLTLRDDVGAVIDFWAHGSSLFGAPAGVSFSPAPLQLILNDTNSITYQRSEVTSQGLAFFAADWVSAPASRNAINSPQAECAQCLAIDALDDLFSVINDGTAADFFVLANDECRDDAPISVVALPGDLLPDQGVRLLYLKTHVRPR